MPLERPAAHPPSLRQVVSDFSGFHGANAVVAFTFAASGPVAIVLAIGTRGGLRPSEIASWLFSVFFVNGLITCLTGPVNAIISATEDKRRQYTAGMAVGVLACIFGLLSPAVARVMLGTPRAFIAALAGLAMLRVLQSAFAIAFRERHALGALAAFLVTVADVGIVGIGAPFWGLVLGVGVAALLERDGPTP